MKSPKLEVLRIQWETIERVPNNPIKENTSPQINPTSMSPCVSRFCQYVILKPTKGNANAVSTSPV